MYEQISLFDVDTTIKVNAVCCMDGRKTEAKKPDAKMKEIVPEGEYVVYIGGHSLVLKPTQLTPSTIPNGHRFYHYMIHGRVFAGIFVGTDKDKDITQEDDN